MLLRMHCGGYVVCTQSVSVCSCVFCVGFAVDELCFSMLSSSIVATIILLVFDHFHSFLSVFHDDDVFCIFVAVYVHSASVLRFLVEAN